MKLVLHQKMELFLPCPKASSLSLSWHFHGNGQERNVWGILGGMSRGSSSVNFWGGVVQ